MEAYDKSDMNKVVRGAKRAAYDKDVVNDIIDGHLLCHVAYVHEGVAIAIPTGYGRVGNTLYLHGAMSNRMLKSLLAQEKISMTITHLDGLVLARSVFHHSFNYRSVVIFGKPRLIEHSEDKNEALRIITENIIPGRWGEARVPNEVELKRTLVIAVDIEEASAKVRAEGVNDEPEDHELDVWAGVLPLKTVTQAPVPEPDLKPGVPISPSIANYTI